MKESSLREKNEELAKVRGEVNSLNVKLKWAQNKLKSESEAHKEAQSKLTTTLQKLQESREEGEQIRNDMKAMIVAYQVCVSVQTSLATVYYTLTATGNLLHKVLVKEILFYILNSLILLIIFSI